MALPRLAERLGGLFRRLPVDPVGAGPRPGWVSLLLASLPLATSGLLQLEAATHPEKTERWYGRVIYPGIESVLGQVTARIPFALGEVLLGLALAVTLVLLARGARAWRDGRLEGMGLVLACRALVVLGGLSLLFMLLWGLNYQRKPVLENLGLRDRRPTRVDAVRLARGLVLQLNQARADIASHHRASVPHGTYRWPVRGNPVDLELEAAYPSTAVPEVVKPFAGSPLMSRLGLTGVFMPFTSEPCYNSEIPAFDVPFAKAHELAHRRGVARESEANFVAFLLCAYSDDPTVRYSGWMGASGLLTSLRRTLPVAFMNISTELAPGPAADLEARRRFWKSHEGPLMRMGRGVNDVYLRLQGIETGIRNYAEGDALIAAYINTTESGWICVPAHPGEDRPAREDERDAP